jgi:hypothetical protein
VCSPDREFEPQGPRHHGWKYTLDSPDFMVDPFADQGQQLSPNEKTACAFAQTVFKIDLL